MSYFSTVVLPSSQMSKKVSYNINEVLELLGISRSTFYRRVAEGKLVLTRDKRVYYKELEKYFDLLPDFSNIKNRFNSFIKNNTVREDIINWIESNLMPGDIDVNIMTESTQNCIG